MTWTVRMTCVHGHDIAVVGRYAGGRCKECTRIAVRAYKARKRKVRQMLRLTRPG